MNKIRKNLTTKSDINNMNASFILSIGCGILHVAYFIIFIIIGVMPLVYFNVFSVVFYIIMTVICKRRPFFMLFALTEILIYTIYSVMILGDNSGFQLILISLVPATFFVVYLNKIKSRVSAYIVAGAFISYIVLTIFNHSKILTAKIIISSTNGTIILVFNSIVVFAVIIATSIVFIKKIKQKEEGLENQNERLSKLANVDPLTELLNRRSINQKLELSMQRKINLNIDFTVAIADIDNFKDLNDAHGHDCGDKVLVNIAEEIGRAVRDTDYVCRWGGEEILILFCGSGQEHAGRVLERIRKNIEKNGGIYEDSRINVTMTFGVSSSEQYSSVKDIILKADENLYHGKRSGKNCIVYS